MPSDRGALATLTQLFAAIAILAIEMQLATWSSIGTLRSLLLLNLALVLMAFLTTPGKTVRLPGGATAFGDMGHPYVVATGLLVVVVVAIVNAMLPLQSADPYHLARVAQIERFGTLAYDPLVTDQKVNVLGWAYELVLADIDQTPLIGRALLRMHGLLGIAMYALAIAASRRWLPAGTPWTPAALFVVPVVFHQLVLIKNDLFAAVPALVALGWLVSRAPAAAIGEVAWASWLVGFAVGMKITSAPVAAVFAAALLMARRDRMRVLAAATAGGLAGALCAGLGFTLLENARWYGDPIAVHEAGGDYNRNVTLPQMATSVFRFAISLFDFGTITRSVWPGRGGWGSTFGLPMVWALVMLAVRYRESEYARRALWITGACFLIFAAIYTDADIAHRLTLAPGLLVIVVAVSLSAGDDVVSRRMRQALVAVTGLSALQIVRSALLYLTS